MKIGEGKGKLSGESFPFPSPNPTPSSSKTFDLIESLPSDCRRGARKGDMSFLLWEEARTCSRLFFMFLALKTGEIKT